MAQNDAIQLQQQNAVMRRLLIQNSSKVLLPLPVERTTAGGIARVKLNNTGLLTRLLVEVKIPWTKAEDDTAANPRPFEAAEAVKRVRLLDYDGSSRVDLPLKLLLLMNAMRKRGILGGAAHPISPVSENGASTTYQSDFVDGGQATTALATTATSGDLMLTFEVPVAADVERGDLRGMMDLQFTSGEVYLNIEFANQLAGTTDLFAFDSTGVTVAMGSPEVHVWQEYYLPENVNGIRPIPALDVSTVYELGSYLPTNDNISPANEKRINFPVVREINGLAWTYLSSGKYGGAASAADDMQQLRILANGNNVLRDVSRRTHQWLTRRALGYDLGDGTGVMDFADAPVSTAIFGNVQIAMTPGATVAAPLLEVGFESIYAKNAALSGVPV